MDINIELGEKYLTTPSSKIKISQFLDGIGYPYTSLVKVDVIRVNRRDDNIYIGIDVYVNDIFPVIFGHELGIGVNELELMIKLNEFISE